MCEGRIWSGIVFTGAGISMGTSCTEWSHHSQSWWPQLVLPSDNTGERTGERRFSDRLIYCWSSQCANHLPARGDPGDLLGAPPTRGPSPPPPPPISILGQCEPPGCAGDTGASLQISEATRPELHTDFQPGVTPLLSSQLYRYRD